MVARVKGRDMLVGRFVELLGITVPAGESSEAGR
jgi:hypothetical protein